MKDLVVIDCETTGLNKQTDRIVQLSAMRFDRATMKPLAKFDRIIRPTGQWKIDAWATETHGITEEMVINSGVYLADVVEEFLTVIKDADIVGYNSNSFDVQVIYNELLRIGVELSLDRKFYDVLLIEKYLHPSNLGAVFARYMGKNMEEYGLTAHDSMSDVKATAGVLKKQLELIQWDEIDSLDFTTMVCPEGSIISKGNGILYFNVGKYRDKPVEDVYDQDKGYISWWAKNIATPHSAKMVKLYLQNKGRQ